MEGPVKTIDHLFDRYTCVLGKDALKYRNHVYRVYYNCLLLDTSIGNREKYAIAAFFHDIGIWTHKTIDYLHPSIAIAKDYLVETGRPEWIDEVALMIDMHHKLGEYSGNQAQTIEVFRKADWIDVSLGLRSFAIQRRLIKANRRKYPNKGFHLFLIKRIAGSFLRHPFRNPLPMFKR
jgi:hypothetical protein